MLLHYETEEVAVKDFRFLMLGMGASGCYCLIFREWIVSASFSMREVPSIVLGVEESDLLTHAIPYLNTYFRKVAFGRKNHGVYISVDVLHLLRICALILELYARNVTSL